MAHNTVLETAALGVQVSPVAPIFVGMVKRKHGRLQTPVLAGSTPATDTTLSAPDGKASVSHTDKTRFDPGREYQSRVFSSAEERLRDMQEAAGSSPARRTIHGLVAQW